MHKKPTSTAIVLGLLLAVFLWGASNAATKLLVGVWSPSFTGSTRFLVAGLLFCALLRHTTFLGKTRVITPEVNRRLWIRGGLSLAAYILAFNYALKFGTVAHVTLCLGAAPVWALLWDSPPKRNWESLQRYGAAALAFAGVVTLIWPALRHGTGKLGGDLLGVVCSVLWASYGRQSRFLSRDLSGPEVSAQIFWRVGVILAPFALVEIATLGHAPPMHAKLWLAQLVCIFGGSIGAFALWNTALSHWKTSQVYLFNNLVPVSSMAWAYFCLGEEITATFWRAMVLIVAAVLIGQANLQSLFGRLWVPAD